MSFRGGYSEDDGGEDWRPSGARIPENSAYGYTSRYPMYASAAGNATDSYNNYASSSGQPQDYTGGGQDYAGGGDDYGAAPTTTGRMQHNYTAASSEPYHDYDGRLHDAYGDPYGAAAGDPYGGGGGSSGGGSGPSQPDPRMNDPYGQSDPYRTGDSDPYRTGDSDPYAGANDLYGGQTDYSSAGQPQQQPQQDSPYGDYGTPTPQDNPYGGDYSGGAMGATSASPYAAANNNNNTSLNSFHDVPTPYQDLWQQQQNSQDGNLARARIQMDSSSSSHNLPQPKEGAAMAPSTKPVEPPKPTIRYSRRCGKKKRTPDLSVGKTDGTPLKEDEILVACQECRENLKVKKSAVLVQCRRCQTVSPASVVRRGETDYKSTEYY